MKRGEERIKATLGIAGGHLSRLADYGLHLLRRAKNSADSPLDKTGPMPAELLKDPFAVEAVPWGMQNPAVSQDLTRQRIVWITALAVSWSVTAISFLRAFRIV
jgi:hypothetical protein